MRGVGEPTYNSLHVVHKTLGALAPGQGTRSVILTSHVDEKRNPNESPQPNGLWLRSLRVIVVVGAQNHYLQMPEPKHCSYIGIVWLLKAIVSSASAAFVPQFVDFVVKVLSEDVCVVTCYYLSNNTPCYTGQRRRKLGTGKNMRLEL